MRVLVTGGCGFIGANLVHYLAEERPDWFVVNLDKLTYAANPASVAELEGRPGYRFVQGDVGDAGLVEALIREHALEAIFHLAAETHVDRAISGPSAFVETNVLGTQVLLEAALRARLRRVLVVSTDEVYGPLEPPERAAEDSPLLPSNPYSASKAGADLLALSYQRTFGLDVVITRAANNYGRFQHCEKLIPLMVLSALHDRPLPVYGDGRQVREWLHVDDHCRGLLLAMERGRSGHVYNLGGEAARPNLQTVRSILAVLGKPESLIRHVVDRPAHDRRYALDASRALDELGWAPQIDPEQGLADTIRWYATHRPWWEAAWAHHVASVPVPVDAPSAEPAA
jgi:dTDP-glucose 4,6-dehydratase